MEREKGQEVIEKAETEEKSEEKGKKKKGKRKADFRILVGFVIGVLVSCLAFMLFLVFPFSTAVDRPNSLLAYKKTVQIKKLIDQYYMGDVDEQMLTDYQYIGLIAGLQDPYAAYFTEEEYAALSTKQSGYYTGIGVSLANRTEDGALVIISVEEDGPADRAGVQAEDIITAINGEDASEMTTSYAAALVQAADEITLSILREETEETFDVTMVKEQLEQASVTSEITEDGIGIIKIASFRGVTASQFKTTYKSMREQGITALVVDLRDNTGGLVSAVCDTMRQILPKGVMVYTVDKYGEKTEKTCDGANEIDIPMAVVVNENTASASEIFSGAVQDYGVGVIVGTQTYGKGIVQDVFRLSDGSVIRLTVSHYYTPKGNDIHETGITPDIYIEESDAEDADEAAGDSAQETDLQLEAALQAVREQLG